MEDEFKERRNARRINNEAEAEYKILADDTDLMGLRYRKAKTRNISLGGLCLKTALKLDEGNVVRVEVPVGKEKINTFCEVEWCRPESGSFLAGLSFISLAEDDIENINNIIKH